MPPWREVASQMLLSFLPPGGSGKKGFENWTEMGRWEADLDQGRREPSPEMKQKVAELTAGSATSLARMQALAKYVQKDIRYVAIELGIGGLAARTRQGTSMHIATEIAKTRRHCSERC